MKKGQIIEVKDKHGGMYEAILLWNFPCSNSWRIEWAAGPNDGDNAVAVFDPMASDDGEDWKIE